MSSGTTLKRVAKSFEICFIHAGILVIPGNPHSCNPIIAERSIQLWLAFFQKFFRGESIATQISFVMLIFLLFSDQILLSRSLGGANCLKGAPPALSVEESQCRFVFVGS